MQSAVPRARAAVAAVLAVVLMLRGAGTAVAHGDPGAEHAADDLAGVPMTVVEREAAARANAIAWTTGVRPGQRSATDQRRANAIAAAADAGEAGAWSAVVDTPVVPVFTAMLPNGKVLMWDSVGDGPAESNDDHSFTRAAVWNPVTNTGKRVDVKGYNIFCAGFVQLSDGTVLVAGGNRDKALHGLRTTHLFDWRTETWRRGPDMHAERWYPSVAALPNAEALIAGGGPATPEVYQTNQWVRLLTGVATPASKLYPMLTVRPDGNVDLIAPWTTMQTLTTGGAGGVKVTAPRDTITRDYASFAMFRPGRTLVSGGGSVDEDGLTKVPTRTAMIIGSTTAGIAATSRQTRPMAFARRQHNLTILADGNVLATGGESSAAVNIGVDLNHPVLNAELFDTTDETWRTLGAANRVREYHSTAILLPDGRVMTGGGGICAECQRVGYLERNVEYFEPPYLFRNDGSGEHATRPVIDSAPASASYGTSYSVTSAQAGTIAKVGLVRLGAPTHGDDQGQRYVPATFTRSGTTLTVRAPANVNQAPPGYYMLFITDSAGVPSVAKFVKLTATPPAAPAPVRVTVNRPGGRCADVDHSVFAPGTRIQMWDCNATPAQRWTRPADLTLRVSPSLCLGYAGGRTAPGTDVRLAACTGAEKWSIRPDGTIRPSANLNVCLTATGNQAEQIKLATCTVAASQIFRYS